MRASLRAGLLAGLLLAAGGPAAGHEGPDHPTSEPDRSDTAFPPAEAGRFYDGSRPDSHAPLGVMGDHRHAAGEWMLSYRYARMGMSGNRDGTERLDREEVLADFPVTPTRMDMERHVFGLMWAPHDRVTLMAMLPFVRLDMEHRTRRGARFTTRSKGIGDVGLSALVGLHDGDASRLHLNAGLSLPTGSISEKDDTPMGRVRLPYPMQLGSGTVDLRPGLTWTLQRGPWSVGAQLRSAIRLGRNRKGYRLGHEAGATAWVARVLAPWLSASFRLDGLAWGDVEGDDDALNPALVPTADPDLRGGERVDALVGLNVSVKKGPLRGHRFALEAGAPVYQHLDGPQLETDWRVVAGWQLAF